MTSGFRDEFTREVSPRITTHGHERPSVVSFVGFPEFWQKAVWHVINGDVVPKAAKYPIELATRP